MNVVGIWRPFPPQVLPLQNLYNGFIKCHVLRKIKKIIHHKVANTLAGQKHVLTSQKLEGGKKKIFFSQCQSLKTDI